MTEPKKTFSFPVLVNEEGDVENFEFKPAVKCLGWGKAKRLHRDFLTKTFTMALEAEEAPELSEKEALGMEDAMYSIVELCYQSSEEQLDAYDRVPPGAEAEWFIRFLTGSEEDLPKDHLKS